MAETITINVFDSRSITDAIKDIKAYKASFSRKVGIVRERIANEIRDEAIAGFARAVCNDTVSGGPRPASVSVTMEADELLTLIIATGEDAVFCEFGAGVYHNGPAGQSPHPKGVELGMTIGSYGKGRGSRKVWGYYTGEDDDRALVLTRGTPASMPMYNAMQNVCQRIINIVTEVFS